MISIRRILLLLLLVASHSALGAIPGRDLYIPIVGRAVGSGGREYRTTLFFANTTDSPSDATLSFLPAGQETPKPVHARVQVPAHSSVAYEVDDALVGNSSGVGALRMQSRQPLVAVARTFSRAAGAAVGSEVGGAFEGVPADRAIGNGETTLLPGVSAAAGRYKVYAVEVAGQAVQVELALIGPDGSVGRSRRLFLRGSESRAWDIASELGLAEDASGALRVSAVNGSGKLIVAGELIAPASLDGTPFNMTIPLEARHRLSTWEIAAYAAIALALLAAVIVARRR